LFGGEERGFFGGHGVEVRCHALSINQGIVAVNNLFSSDAKYFQMSVRHAGPADQTAQRHALAPL
jgi:hypothetical protein